MLLNLPGTILRTILRKTLSEENMRELTHNDLAIGWPNGWLDVSNVTLIGPASGGFTPNITINRQRLEKPVGAEEYAAEQQLQLAKKLEASGFRVLNHGPFRLGAIIAYQRTQVFMAPAAKVEVTQLQVHAVRNLEAVVITATDKASTFERNLPIFKASIDQFKWSTP